jgi:hypothetical protein
MSVRFHVGLVLAILLASPVPAVAAPGAAPADGAVVGTVRETDGSPAPGVEVWLVRSWAEPSTPKVKTDADGRYRIVAPAGEYIEAMFSVYAPHRGPTGYAHAVRRMVYRFGPTIPAGGATTIDVTLPDATVGGTCGMSGCTIDVVVAGFAPGEVLAVTLVADLMVGDHSFAQRLATLVAGADGSARGTFVTDGLERAAYGIAVAGMPPQSGTQLKVAETAKTLKVGPPPCTDPPCLWSAYSGRLSGRATLTLPATGRAIASFTASAPAPGVNVGGSITAGAGCGTDAEAIATFPGYRATSTRERTQRIVIGGARLARLRVIEQDGTPLWFRFAVGKRWSCVRLWRRG